jgi:hypothetical protein
MKNNIKKNWIDRLHFLRSHLDVIDNRVFAEQIKSNSKSKSESESESESKRWLGNT